MAGRYRIFFCVVGYLNQQKHSILVLIHITIRIQEFLTEFFTTVRDRDNKKKLCGL